eukprot:CAMPEP_0197622594 /NCGR_PEP_ID=MMETSP1338-20131121/2832_1 /TAXON_ID=43686 ORGANISM="Pelagodinium beii, Strain RCC1491" /NCGR_SAMPLE_ID=MMETSP1338 /ASSEMBLY_ACC=CAM_ASM_000754 /LENGTH=1104 /DNA_ID=CAMNT_0043192337 /DNA_START=96 /DNA_END=3407 /DNA_ORIENTATION=-
MGRFTHSILVCLVLVIEVAVSSQTCSGVGECEAPSSSSLLQKDGRVQKISAPSNWPMKEASDSRVKHSKHSSKLLQHYSKKSASSAPYLMETEDADRMRFILFLAVLTIGTALHFINWKSVQAMFTTSSSSESASRDSIAGTGATEGESCLTTNAELLKDDAPPAALSLLDLLPDTTATALCKDGDDPEPLSYAELRSQITNPNLSDCFNPGERVAMVLDNGKEMAVCMLAVMYTACAVPLNPTFTEAELSAAMEQLRCTAVVVRPGPAGEAARTAATNLGLRILTLSQTGAGKALSLEGPRVQPQTRPQEMGREVLLLKTSGTTSKGKVVTFSLERLSLAARYNARCMKLGQGSICLSMMPLYHIAGISVNFLASMSAGATVLFYSGLFEVKRFSAELERPDDYKPTWYFAVPAVHDAVLAHAADLGRPLRHRLTMIRSAGAALLQDTGLRLVGTFDCAVTPAYGMTEALEITCPPMGYRLEKPGSIGPSISAEIQLMDGEVCVRGNLVMPGYEFHGPAEDDPNTEAWTGSKKGQGFLRTGDLGYMDKDGWLFLTGRCKEMINRGGETINPHEVEPAVLSKPEIDAAVCFAAPHKALGECIAVAVVLKKGFAPQQVPPMDILKHCSSRASQTMTPEVILYLPREALPTTATKKFIRAGLAQRLGLTLDMVLEASVFVYDEATKSLAASNLKTQTFKLTDSLGQLREASGQDVIEQNLKDGLFGIGIMEVMTKHWYNGHYDNELWSWALHPYDKWANSPLLFMTLFFVLSGHTAAQTKALGFGALLHRWASLYLMMTLAAVVVLGTCSLRVDWFFAWLMINEMLTICVDSFFTDLPEAMGRSRKTLAACTMILGSSLVAAAVNMDRPADSDVFKSFVDFTHAGVGSPLTTPMNLLTGNIDFAFNQWAYGLLGVWSCAFGIGFYALPELSKAVWSKPRLLNLLANPAVRLFSAFAVIELILDAPTWPTSTDGWWWFGAERGTNASDFMLEFIACNLSLAHALLTVALMAITIGPHARTLQSMGKVTAGVLVTHTMFGKMVYPFYHIQPLWNFHDVLQLEAFKSVPTLPLLFMAVIPVLYILSLGTLAQKVIDQLVKFPWVSILIW